MVTVFFVISGYALSYGPLETIHDGRAAEAASRLGSATFRRAPRLFLPVLPVLVATAVPQWLGLYYGDMRAREPSAGEGSFWRQLGASEADLVRLMHRNGGELQVSLPQAWTLDLECSGSFLVFAACLALRRVGYRARVLCVLLVAAWLFHALEWGHCMFLCGMALADMNIARRRWRGDLEAASGGGGGGIGGAGSSAAAPLLPLHDQEEKALSPLASLGHGDDGDDGQQDEQDDDVSTRMSTARPKTVYNRLAAAPAAASASASVLARLKTAGWWTVLLLSLLLGGWPVGGGDVRDVWPYSWATWLLGGARPMTGRLALSVASVLLVASLDRLPRARRLLDSLLVRYLGEISYGLYLCHILAARTTLSQGLRIELEERWGGDKFAPWAIVLFGVVLPGAVWLGDLHWRLVDKKCVRFTRWLSEWLGV